MKILIIDDNVDITTMLSKYMTIKGHSCSVVNDGRNGLNLIENQKFDAIILDLDMPDFTGRNIVDSLYKSGKIKDLIIIILTASATDDDELDLKSKGVRLFLKKSEDPDVILDYLYNVEFKISRAN